MVLAKPDSYHWAQRPRQSTCRALCPAGRRAKAINPRTCHVEMGLDICSGFLDRTVLGFSGVAAGAAGIAKILFVVCLVVFVALVALTLLGVGALKK